MRPRRRPPICADLRSTEASTTGAQKILPTVALEISLLGGFCLRWQGQVHDALRPGKAQLLLSYLLLHRDRPLPRARVASALWPDSSEDQARTNLRRELHSLRQLLPEPDHYLRVDARQLAWNTQADYRLDVEELETGRRAELYAGELLPGHYEDWLLDHRERLARLGRELLEEQLAAQEAQSRWREAAETARRLIALDPAEEESHRRLMRIHLALQDPAAAHKAFLECQKRLRQELDVEPSLLTRNLLAAAPPTAAAGPPLLGRQRELALLQHWNRRQVLLLVGEPGIGKTRLLTEVKRLSGGPCLWGRGYEVERTRPFGPWLEALRDYPEALATLRCDSTHKARELLFDPLVDWLRARFGWLILFDDLQWFDESSLALMHYAVRILPGVQWAATLRSGACEGQSALLQLLRSLRRSDQLVEIHPEPLDEQAIAQLVHWANPESPAVGSRCGGNPLLALELAQSRQHRLESCLQERLERLGSVALEIASWAAVLGRAFHPELLERSLGRGLFEVLPALEELEEQRLLLAAEQGYLFRHDVLRELTYAQLSQPRRRLIHLHIARVLRENPISWAEVARHACLAQDAPGAAEACLKAAEQSLQVLAFQETLQFVQEGLAWVGRLPSSQQATGWQMELLRLESLAGVSPRRGRELAAELTQLLELSGGESGLETTAYEALSGLAYELQRDGEVEEYSRRLAARAPQRPAQEAARWLAHSGNCLASIGRDLPRAEALLAEAEQLAERCHLHLIDLPLGRGLVEYHHGRLTEARRHFEQGVELARNRNHPWWRAQGLACLGRLLLEMEDYAGLEPVVQELGEVGDGTDSQLARALAELVLYARGGAAQAVLDCLPSLRESCRSLAFVARNAAQLALRRGESEQALAWATQALQAAATVQHPGEMARSRAAWIEAAYLLGQPGPAQQELRLLRKEVASGRPCQAAQADLQRLFRRWGGLAKEETDGTGTGREQLGAAH